jgi:hypothetical protein
MPSHTAGQIERCLIRKLRAVELQGGNHRRFEVFDGDGRLVAATVLSRSWRRTTTLGPNMVAAIQRELGLQGDPSAFDELVRCPLSRDAYLAIAGRSGAP